MFMNQQATGTAWIGL